MNQRQTFLTPEGQKRLEDELTELRTGYQARTWPPVFT